MVRADGALTPALRSVCDLARHQAASQHRRRQTKKRTPFDIAHELLRPKFPAAAECVTRLIPMIKYRIASCVKHGGRQSDVDPWYVRTSGRSNWLFLRQLTQNFFSQLLCLSEKFLIFEE